MCLSPLQDRIKLGSNTLYLYVGFKSERSRDDHQERYNYDYFQTELAEAAGFSESMMSVDDNMPDTSTLLVFQEYVNLLPKIYEANAMSEEMKKVGVARFSDTSVDAVKIKCFAFWEALICS